MNVAIVVARKGMVISYFLPLRPLFCLAICFVVKQKGHSASILRIFKKFYNVYQHNTITPHARIVASKCVKKVWRSMTEKFQRIRGVSKKYGGR